MEHGARLKWQVAVVAGATLLAMLATALWVPVEVVHYAPAPPADGEGGDDAGGPLSQGPDGAGETGASGSVQSGGNPVRFRVDGLQFKRVWRTGRRPDREYRIVWGLVAVEAGAILLLGGGLATWLVHRGRRRANEIK